MNGQIFAFQNSTIVSPIPKAYFDNTSLSNAPIMSIKWCPTTFQMTENGEIK